MLMLEVPRTKLSLYPASSSSVLPAHSSGLSSSVVSPCIGGSIGPTLTFGYPKSPTKTDGGLDPSSVSDESFAEFSLTNCLQFCSSFFLISSTVICKLKTNSNMFVKYLELDHHLHSKSTYPASARA